MSQSLTVFVEGVGCWASRATTFATLRELINGAPLPEPATARPSPAILPPAERRRAPDTVALALVVGLEACAMAKREPRDVPAVFVSTHGDLGVCDYTSSTLASDPTSLSPIKFHNSVHNAAVGYWTIGTGCMHASTALSAHSASWGNALLEAATQALADDRHVLLVGYDVAAVGALATQTKSDGLFGAGVVLSPTRTAQSQASLPLSLGAVEPVSSAKLAVGAHGNAMFPAQSLLEAVASKSASRIVHAINSKTRLSVGVTPLDALA